MKKRVIATILGLSLSAFALTACNEKGEDSAVIEMSEEEKVALEEKNNKIIAEYAAGILMKYNSGSNTRVLDGYKLVVAEEKEKARRELEEKRQQEKAAYEAAKVTSDKTASEANGEPHISSGMAISSDPVETVSYVEDMSQAIGLAGFSITYSGYEVTSTYPNSDNGMYFTVDASQGRTLLVTKFNITNNSGQVNELNMLGISPDFTLQMMGKNIRAHRTMLLEDLSMYKGNLEAGEAIEGVLIFEIPVDDSASIDGMDLVITMGETNTWMKLEEGSGVEAVATDLVVEEEPVVWEESNSSESAQGTDESVEASNGENGSEMDSLVEEVNTITTVGSQGSILVEPAN